MNTIPRRILDVFLGTAVEKGSLFGSIVPEAIPLGTTLGVEDQYIVVDGSGGLVFENMLKGRSTEAGSGHAIESPVCGDTHSIDYLTGGGRGILGGQ